MFRIKPDILISVLTIFFINLQGSLIHHNYVLQSAKFIKIFIPVNSILDFVRFPTYWW